MQRDRRMEAGGEPPFPPCPESGVTDPAPSAPGSSMTAALPTQSDQRVRFALMWVIPILVAALVSFAPPVLNDGDSFWHVSAGRWMLDHRTVPHTDPFTYTFAGKPWVAHEWLSEVFMALAWLAAGWSGVMLLAGLAMGALAAVMGRWLIRWMPAPGALLALVLALAGVAPGLLARPHLFVLPILALWTVGLLQARDEGRAPSPWLIPLMALWANMHGSFIIGLALGGGFFLETLLDLRRWRRRVIVGWAVVLGASVLATLATPQGLEGLLFPFQLLNMKTLIGVGEWRAPDFITPDPLEFEILVGLLLLFWRGARLTAVRALIGIGLLHSTLQHVRQEMLLAVVAPLIAAEALGRTMQVSTPRPTPWRLPVPQMALGAGLAAVLLVARIAVPQNRTDAASAPISALAAVPAPLRVQPVLNDYDFGGYLIFKGVKPFVDGRTDMFGDAFLSADQAIERGDAAAAAAAIGRWHIRWAIFRPERGAIRAMDSMAGWKRLHTDKYAIVWEKVAP